MFIVQAIGGEKGFISQSLGRAAELDAVEVEVGQSGFGLGDPVRGQDEDHGEPVALVRHLQRSSIDILLGPML
jgi:hypothetical protein